MMLSLQAPDKQGSGKTSQMVKVVLADDHKVVRHGIRMVLEAESDFRVVGEASDSIQATNLVESLAPDVLVTDLSMDGMSGFEVITRARQRSPKTLIVVLSMHDNAAYVLKALQCGAKGYVLKDAGPDELTCAVRAVLTGATYLSPPLSAERIEAYRQSLYAGD